MRLFHGAGTIKKKTLVLLAVLATTGTDREPISRTADWFAIHSAFIEIGIKNRQLPRSEVLLGHGAHCGMSIGCGNRTFLRTKPRVEVNSEALVRRGNDPFKWLATYGGEGGRERLIDVDSEGFPAARQTHEDD
jgi:hypothetical protein